MTITVRRVAEKIENLRFNRALHKISSRAPLAPPAAAEQRVVVVSQIHHAAVNMAILALRSFSLHFPYVRLELLDDGSLTKSDVARLNEYLCPAELINVENIDTGKCPRGNCWERLCYISQRSQSSYVIQVDSDTLSLGPMPEVYNCVANNQPFTVSEPLWSQRVPTEYVSDIQCGNRHNHIQVRSERILSEYESAPSGYIRGCAAFAGFDKGPNHFEELQRLSMFFQSRLGTDTWNQWGSEQFASNVIVSMNSHATALPWPKYQNYKLPRYIGEIEDAVSMIHFIGTTRFSDGTYRQLAKEFLHSNLQ